MDFIINNWEWLLPVSFIIAEKAVKLLPVKYQDIVLDIIVSEGVLIVKKILKIKKR